MLICKCLETKYIKQLKNSGILKRVIILQLYYLIKIYKNMHFNCLFSIIYVTFIFLRWFTFIQQQKPN